MANTVAANTELIGSVTAACIGVKKESIWCDFGTIATELDWLPMQRHNILMELKNSVALEVLLRKLKCALVRLSLSIVLLAGICNQSGR